jgi:hypothetical protein
MLQAREELLEKGIMVINLDLELVEDFILKVDRPH